MTLRFRFLGPLVALLLAFTALCVHAGPFDVEGLDRLERQLRMNPEQKAQFDVAAAATRRALMASALSGMEFKDRLQRELLRSRPDLGVIFEAQEAMLEQNGPLFRSAREEWLRLYGMLDEDQVRVAKQYVERSLMGMEAVADAFRKYLGQQLR